MKRRLLLPALMTLCLSASGAMAQGAPAAPATPAACPALLNHTVDRLQDEKPQNLCQYAGRVVLVVNTASFCGFTPQYEALEALQRRYADRGLVVLGFPSNDFAQETGSNQQIADFCENTFGVRFPMFVKTTVTGPQAHPLFRELAQRTGQPPKWNFHKYLIGRDGQVVKAYPSVQRPDGPVITTEVERLLAVKK